MRDFICPASMRPHAARVFAGEYDVPVADVKRVLDIGANVGAFSVWVLSRWPGARVTAYEPHPANAAILRRNVADAPVDVRECALFSYPPGDGQRIVLYDGKNNCGEASIFCGPEQGEGEHVVDVLHPADLPACDVLKVDTEGCEWDILSSYLPLGAADGPRAVMYEWHSALDERLLGAFLEKHGYQLHAQDVTRPDGSRGVARWIRKASS